jgi:hypothetical protein
MEVITTEVLDEELERTILTDDSCFYSKQVTVTLVF